jgi:hypothetical protein
MQSWITPSVDARAQRPARAIVLVALLWYSTSDASYEPDAGGLVNTSVGTCGKTDSEVQGIVHDRLQPHRIGCHRCRAHLK